MCLCESYVLPIRPFERFLDQGLQNMLTWDKQTDSQSFGRSMYNVHPMKRILLILGSKFSVEVIGRNLTAIYTRDGYFDKILHKNTDRLSDLEHFSHQRFNVIPT